MSHIEELQQVLLLDEEQYYSEDRFIEVEELIERLSEKDVPALLHAWSTQTRSWRERFVHASRRIDRVVVEALLREATARSSEPDLVLSLMTNLPRVAEESELNTLLVQYLAAVWADHPNLHRQIQMCSWSCGLSRRILTALGYKSWKEAGL
ncbi:hypothetical protein [Methyloversatilis discipulorum]|uniref:hypothetical protein n=1 Tax=Methyloversatilis discipulorum TaxID=1119528 RepID=UPI0012F98F36|nr:hypothetical protein [Methyloversatilis discipulorum]